MMHQAKAGGQAELRQKLDEHFSAEELRTLCFELSVDWDNLPAQGKGDKARELVALLGRQGRAAELAAAAARQRPSVDWPTPDAAAQGESSDWAEPGELPSRVGGDVIIAQVGAGSKGVAVGKHVTQTFNNAVHDREADDAQVIARKLDEVAVALDRVRGQAAASAVAVAEFQIQLLRTELGKGESDVPSATTILQVGDGLLANLPQLGPALASLFTTPGVRQVMRRAGESAVAWSRARFGS